MPYVGWANRRAPLAKEGQSQRSQCKFIYFSGVISGIAVSYPPFCMYAVSCDVCLQSSVCVRACPSLHLKIAF